MTMIFFAVITGSPEAVRPAHQSALTAVERQSPVAGGSVSGHIASGARWAIAAYNLPDPICQERLVCSEEGAFVLNGPLIAFDGVRGDKGIIACAEHLQANGIESAYQRLTGTFCCAGFNPRDGVFAFPDFTGMSPVYMAEGAGLAVVSNKPAIIADILGSRAQDLNSLSWLVGHANIFGAQMPNYGVDYVVPGTLVQSRNRSRFETKSLPAVWPAAGDASELRDNLSSAEWDEVTHVLVENAKAAISYLPETRIGLTGGKDSRVSLSLLRAAGGGAGLSVFTSGPDTSPEIECALKVAAAAGVDHEWKPRAADAPPPKPYDTATMWQVLRWHNSRHDGAVCPWDGRSGHNRGVTIEVTGFGGELYRGPGGHAKQFKKLRLDSRKTAQDAWINYHQRVDALGILRPAFRNYQDEWLRNWVGTEANDVRLDVLPEKFYVDYRLGHWNGTMAQNMPTRIKLTPLISWHASAKVFQLSPEARTRELLHFEVMRRLAPELTRLPFLSQSWDPALVAQYPDLPAEPFKPTHPPTPSNLAPQQVQFVKEQAVQIEAVLRRSAEEHDLDEMIDVEKAIISLGDEKAMSVVINVKQILSAISVAFSLSGEGVMPKDGPH